MKHKKTIYLSKQAEEKLKTISNMEKRSNSNMIEYLIIKHTPRIYLEDI